MTYRDRRRARAERLRGWAEKREAKADVEHGAAGRMADAIPFGQPVLVGHYSERRDRNYRDRIHRKMDRAVADGRKADEMRRKADNIDAAADRAIYDDDDDAVEQLTARIVELEAERDEKKAANAAYRKTGDLDVIPEHLADEAARNFRHWPGGAKVPFPALKNLSANIRRNKKRLESLTQTRKDPTP